MPGWCIPIAKFRQNIVWIFKVSTRVEWIDPCGHFRMSISIVKARLASGNFHIIKWRKAVGSEGGGMDVFVQAEKVGVNALGINFMLHSFSHMYVKGSRRLRP